MKNVIKLKKTLFSLTLIFVLTLSLLPTTVNAASTDTLLIAGKDIIKESSKTITLGKGYAKYDEATKTLELNNATIDSTAENAIEGTLADSLTIKVIGTNTIKSNYSGAATVACGIKLNTPVLNVIGNDAKTSRLDISFAVNDREHEALQTSAMLNIKDINFSAKQSVETYIYSDGISNLGKPLNIDNSTIEISGFFWSIYSDGPEVTMNKSKLTLNNANEAIYQTEAQYQQEDIYSNGTLPTKITFNDCDINYGNAIIRKNTSSLICTGSNEVILNNTRVTSNDDTFEAGIIAGKLSVINGSKININTDYWAMASHGDMLITDSSVYVRTRNTRPRIYLHSSVYVEGSFDIKDSNLDIKATGAPAIAVEKKVSITDYSPAKLTLNSNLAFKGNMKISNLNPPVPTSSSYYYYDYASFLDSNVTNLSDKAQNGASSVQIYIKDADFKAVDAALNNVPKDLSIYTPTSVKALNDAINAVDRSKKINEQQTIDNYAKAINLAINNLAITPIMLDGNNQTIYEGNEGMFRSNADFKEFKEVLVDGKAIDKTNYTAVSGSTKVTLNSKYLSTLTNGKHTMGITSKNGTATANFTFVKKGTVAPTTPTTPATPTTPSNDALGNAEIKVDGTKPNAPKTSTSNNSLAIISLVLVSGLGLIKVIKRKEVE